jgi:L-lactate dehydrogenase complex protein LldE
MSIYVKNNTIPDSATGNRHFPSAHGAPETLIYNQSVRTAQLFVTCLIDAFFPEVAEAMVSVLRRAGAGVAFAADQTCCGQPLFNAGLRAGARQMAEHTLKVFESTMGDVVVPSGSCAHMIRRDYGELFAEDPAWLARAEALASRTFEFTEYLIDVLGITEWNARWEGPLAYHPTCHLHRSLGIDSQPRALLGMLGNAELRSLPEDQDCCGFGGIFSVEHPEVAAAMLERKVRNLEATGSPTLVVCDAGCLMHIQGGLKHSRRTQRVVHIAEVLAKE